MNKSGRSKKKSSKTTENNKAPYLENRDLALKIMGRDGFESVRKAVGERLDANRASRIVDMLINDYGYKSSDLPGPLLSLAAEKRSGHTGGPVVPPVPGEQRWYKPGKNVRIGIPLGILGKKKGVKTRVKFDTDKIVIYRR